MEERPRPLYVPDLTRPSGADIAADGTVTCVACGARIDVNEADLVGKGYRCARCSALATPEDDADASLSPSEQAHVPDVPRRAPLVAAGFGFTAIAVVMWITGFDLPLGRLDLFAWMFIAAIGCFALALANHRKWR